MKYYLTRGKRLDTGEWIYGVLLQKPDGSLYIVMNQKNYAVDPDTVGRYTGLRDRMNAQIFHAHILHVVIPSGSKDSFDDYDVGYVVLHNDKYCLQTVRMSRPLQPLLDWCDWCRVEIIGNIHDNPEVLQVFRRFEECRLNAS